MSLLVEILTAALLIAGGVFAFAAGLGLLRMRDLYVRMHASTKAGTLGVGLVMGAVALFFLDGGAAMHSLVVVIFLLLTAPIGAHLIGRAAYRSGVPLWEKTLVDEYAGTADAKPDPTIGVSQQAEEAEQRSAPPPSS